MHGRTKALFYFPSDLYGVIGTAGAPILIDVRRSAAFAADDRMIAGAIRRNPDEIQNWRQELPPERAVVVYCVHGHEVSQEAASALRSAGVDARYLEHGITGWAEHRLPMRSKRDSGRALLGHPRAPEDRSHRLPLADPPLYRSRGRIPVRADRAGLCRRGGNRRHGL